MKSVLEIGPAATGSLWSRFKFMGRQPEIGAGIGPGFPHCHGDRAPNLKSISFAPAGDSDPESREAGPGTRTS